MRVTEEKDAIQRRDEAIELARRYGHIQETNHQAWVIDQMCRVLLGAEYDDWVAKIQAGEEGPNTYSWETGIEP